MKNNQQYQTVNDEYAEVISVNHPLVKVRGFSKVTPGEMVIFDDQSLGQVLGFDKKEIDIMIFSTTPAVIKSKLYRTNTQLSFPITNNLLGNIFSPLGEMLSQGKQNTSKKINYAEIYSTPPKISQRERIVKQMQTGFSITDLLLPIGHGQRELLIGDRKSGKSNFARYLALKQATKGTKIVYAMIAKKVSDIKKAHSFFLKNKVMKDIVIISTTTKDPISSIITTPYAAMTIAEHLMLNQDKDVLLILDDLSSHAEFYRELSLLARKFPGRDSYPGDIFFSHAQLLERAGSFVNSKDQTSPKSITCLPIARTTNSDLTDFIVSNLISITDGHLLFSNHLFNQGIRPAVDFSLSVTRVGKQTQTLLQRDVNLKITSFLSTYQKTKNITHLGSEISDQSQKILHKGQLLTDFFSESKGISINIQLIVIAMIWLEWFEQTHKNVLDTCKFELNSKNQDKSINKKLTEIINQANSFKELLNVVTKNKMYLLSLCQI